MRPFEYVAPETLDEALALLAEHGDAAKVLAGGQSLVPLLNYRLVEPRVVVDVNGVPLTQVTREDGHIRLGALTRYFMLEESRELEQVCPLLGEAVRHIGNVRVRTLGTLGGSLAHGDPAAELPMVMIALDARMTLRSRAGERRVAAGEFFSGYLTTAMRADELLAEVEVPVLDGAGCAVEEHARRAGDFAVVAAAAIVRMGNGGAIADARLAFGGVGPRPVRASGAEAALRGERPTAARLEEAAAAAARALDPQSDAFASGEYRRLLARVLARRALERACRAAS